jgi:hypothetical protein
MRGYLPVSVVLLYSASHPSVLRGRKVSETKRAQYSVSKSEPNI